MQIVRKTQRKGEGENKRTWSIEMNEAREMYLKSYFKIDLVDHLIKNTKIFYRTWKYWHSAMLHAKALAIVTAFDIYKECSEGNLSRDWKMEVDTMLDFWQFCEKLSLKMLEYDPVNRVYPGDQFMWESTMKTKRASPSAS